MQCADEKMFQSGVHALCWLRSACPAKPMQQRTSQDADSTLFKEEPSACPAYSMMQSADFWATSQQHPAPLLHANRTGCAVYLQ